MPSNNRPNGHAGGDSDERTPLVSDSSRLGNTSRLTTNSNGEPLSKDGRWYVRVPSNFVRLTWLTLASNYVNVLLVTVPAGIIVGAMGLNPTAVFIINFLAIVPLAGLLSFATEELSVKLGQTLGGLMNATFGNAVELIVSSHLGVLGNMRILTESRSLLLRCEKAKSESSRPACWVRYCPTSFWCSAAASSHLDYDAAKADSTRQWHQPCLP